MRSKSITPLFLLMVSLYAKGATVDGNSGGGPITIPEGDCIPPQQRQQIEADVARSIGPHPTGTPVGPALYPFQPIAGTVWQDRFINNFVDMNGGAGILDWDCTDFTYNGHLGHDILLRSFAEQDGGVPIYAALDGTVVARRDGQPDRNTTQNAANLPNFVALNHGNGHVTYYFHMRSNSVAVSSNQFVKAGTQIGLAASSGFSDSPHLHFESQVNSVVYEPYAGACQTTTPSRWVTQTPIRRDLYVEMFVAHDTDGFPLYPQDPPRKGTYVRTGGFVRVGGYYILHNLPASSFRTITYLRPNGTTNLASGPFNYGNPFFRYSTWWYWNNINLDVSGIWTMQLLINNQVVTNIPFTVLDIGSTPTNRAPETPIASLDPPVPASNQVVFCRLTPSLYQDLDYDLVRYRFQWKVNNTLVRDTTNAAYSDAVPHSIARTGDFMSCTVTPLDGKTNGQPTKVGVFVGGVGPSALSATALSGTDFRLNWATSGPPYLLEVRTNLSTAAWEQVTNGLSVSGTLNVVTNPGSGVTRYFRLRFPY